MEVSGEGGEWSGGKEDKRENNSPEQEAERQQWFGAHRDGASELFRAIRESYAQIVERRVADFAGTAPKPTWQLHPSGAFGTTGVRSSHHPLCQGGDMGSLADSYKTGTPKQRLYGRPCRLLFLLAGVLFGSRCQRSLSTDGSAQTDRVCFT